MNEIRLEKASDLLIFTSNSTVRSLFFHKLDGKNVYSNFKILQKKYKMKNCAMTPCVHT